MLTHNVYFEGQVQSIGFERNGRSATVGVIAPGEFRFGTGGAERMTITSGALHVRLEGGDAWQFYAGGTSFEVPGKSAFFVRAEAPCAYLCEFL